MEPSQGVVSFPLCLMELAPTCDHEQDQIWDGKLVNVDKRRKSWLINWQSFFKTFCYRKMLLDPLVKFYQLSAIVLVTN